MNFFCYNINKNSQENNYKSIIKSNTDKIVGINNILLSDATIELSSRPGQLSVNWLAVLSKLPTTTLWIYLLILSTDELSNTYFNESVDIHIPFDHFELKSAALCSAVSFTGHIALLIISLSDTSDAEGGEKNLIYKSHSPHSLSSVGRATYNFS